jgi:hypothetical protein
VPQLRYIPDVLNGLLIILLAVQSIPAQQQRQNDRRTWYQAYADAQRDIQQKNWNGAIANIEAASRLGAPKPGRNILFVGDTYRDFNPDYYLGIAYLNLNRFEDADRAFERVKQAQLIAPRDSAYAEFTRQAAAAKDALEKQPTVQVADAGTTAGAPPDASPPLYPPAAPPIDQAVPPPQQSPIQQTPIQQTPSQTADNAGANANAAPVSDAPAGRGAPGAPNARPNPPVPNGTVAQPVAPTTPTPNPALPVKPELERAALVDFFSGQYETAADKLAAVTAAPNRSPRAFFYLACSRAAIALTGRAANAAAAIAEARASLALAGDPAQFAADRRLISPRIRQTLGLP